MSARGATWCLSVGLALTLALFGCTQANDQTPDANKPPSKTDANKPASPAPEGEAETREVALHELTGMS